MDLKYQKKEQGDLRSTPSWLWHRGLSAKLLVLTIVFVMLAEVLIFVPSIANFRMNWFQERLASAQIAVLALEAAPDRMVSEALGHELLKNAGVLAVTLRRPDARGLVLKTTELPMVDRTYDLRNRSALENTMDVFEAIFTTKQRSIRMISKARLEGGNFIEIVIDEKQLRAAMWKFSVNIFILSLIISVIAATLVYLSLNWMLVRPMRSLTRNMIRFREAPEDVRRAIIPSARRDEIGRAELELNSMQNQLRQTLKQKNRLAALGLAVSKISHDLRNLLAHAQLVSDRLAHVDDPVVSRITPKLVSALDRAIDLCSNTLKYGSAREVPPQPHRFELAPLASEVIETLNLGDSNAAGLLVKLDMPDGLEIEADREQLFRVLLNLARNAKQALENHTDQKGGLIVISAHNKNEQAVIEIADNGPGVPDAARRHLFEAFQGSASKGGIGLGLAISSELVQAHGGSLELVEAGQGATFRISLPDKQHEPGKKHKTDRIMEPE